MSCSNCDNMRECKHIKRKLEVCPICYTSYDSGSSTMYKSGNMKLTCGSCGKIVYIKKEVFV